MSEQEKSLMEILTDEENSDNLVLQDADGIETEFEQIATIELNGDAYCILHPVNSADFQMDEEEALVFKLEEDDSLTIVEDEGLAQLVFEEYYKLCDEDYNPET